MVVTDGCRLCLGRFTYEVLKQLLLIAAANTRFEQFLAFEGQPAPSKATRGLVSGQTAQLLLCSVTLSCPVVFHRCVSSLNTAHCPSQYLVQWVETFLQRYMSDVKGTKADVGAARSRSDSVDLTCQVLMDQPTTQPTFCDRNNLLPARPTAPS